ncbi:MAG: hypothetical protein U9O87_04685, partial [Verrucomicrobiota bacterium]|nr:hypothetical protein [Verrucomicrobiota bacterium]
MSDKSKMFTAFSSPEKNSLDLPVHIEYSQKMYFNTVNLLMDKVDDFLNLDEVECTAIKIQVENIIEQLQQEQEMLLGLANSSYSYVLKEFNESNHYLAPIFIHSLNVTIYALKISIDLGIPEERLTYIGIASLLH